MIQAYLWTCTLRSSCDVEGQCGHSVARFRLAAMCQMGVATCWAGARGINAFFVFHSAPSATACCQRDALSTDRLRPGSAVVTPPPSSDDSSSSSTASNAPTASAAATPSAAAAAAATAAATGRAAAAAAAATATAVASRAAVAGCVSRVRRRRPRRGLRPRNKARAERPAGDGAWLRHGRAALRLLLGAGGG